MANRLIPKERADKFACCTALTLILLVKLNYLNVLYNDYANENVIYSYVMLVLGIFVLFNVLGNMYRAIKVDTSIDSVEFTNILLPEWRYCSACEQNSPPRAYHCLTCDKCILKRHSHCMFLGKCVGHKNIRFYMNFIMFVWFATLLSNIANANYFLASVYEFNMKTLVCIFMPWLAWLLGFVTISQFVFIFVNSVCLILFILLILYYIINFQMVSRGQTWHERGKNIHVYNLGIKENLIEAFGFNWFKGFLNPFARIVLPSDGTKFRTNLSAFNNVNGLVDDNTNFYAQGTNNVSKRRII